MTSQICWVSCRAQKVVQVSYIIFDGNKKANKIEGDGGVQEISVIIGASKFFGFGNLQSHHIGLWNILSMFNDAQYMLVDVCMPHPHEIFVIQADGAMSEGILGDVVHPVGAVRAAGAAALASLAKDNEDLVSPITIQLIETFKEKTEVYRL